MASMPLRSTRRSSESVAQVHRTPRVSRCTSRHAEDHVPPLLPRLGVPVGLGGVLEGIATVHDGPEDPGLGQALDEQQVLRLLPGWAHTTRGPPRVAVHSIWKTCFILKLASRQSPPASREPGTQRTSFGPGCRR